MDNERWPQPMRVPDRGDGSPEEEERISYTEARNITGGLLMVAKQYTEAGWRRLVDEHLANAPEEVKEAMYKPGLPGRIPNHLLRILAREGPEYDFGVALLQYGSQYFKEHEDLRWSANMVISSEYADTVMWWTCAPYLFESLVDKGIAAKEAVERIIDWAKSSEAAEPGNDSSLYSKITLAGLEMLEKEGVPRFGLTDKPGDLSHRFAKQEAERIVADVFGIEAKEK